MNHRESYRQKVCDMDSIVSSCLLGQESLLEEFHAWSWAGLG